MKSSLKRILPILLAIVVIISILWYLFIYDKDFTRDMLLKQARFFEAQGKHDISAWLYDQAYKQSGDNEGVAIELAEQFKDAGNYTKAEYTLSNAIADGASVNLYIALCNTYVEQNKLLDAVTMLDNIADPELKAQLDALRPAAPTATPAPGFYSQYITITIASEGNALYVSSDGDYPSMKHDLYADGVPLQAGENTILAVAVSDGGLVSPLAVFGYTVGGVIEEVTLENSELDAQVRQALGMDADARLLTSDLWNITSLSIPESMEDYSDLQYFPYLTSLTIENGKFSDLQALSGMSQLEELTITNASVSAADLTIVAALPKLAKLTLSGCSLSSIQNLSGAVNLRYLDLNNNAIRDISSLSFLSGLQELNLSHNALTNLSVLSELTQLTVLDVSYNSLASLAPLASCTQLTQLKAASNTIGTLTGVENLTALTVLDVSYNDLTEVDLLAGILSLQELNISNNTLLDIASLSPLTKLYYLDFSYNEIEALPQWSADCALVYIDGAYNKLTSVDSLGGYGNLNTVLMAYNSIASVDALANCENLIKVDVSGNPVTDVSKLTDMSVIVNYTPAQN